MAAATLDGVIHLVHPGVSNPLLLTETFSISGIMTARLPISYKAGEATTTSSGYGTLAEAGWGRQTPINGLFQDCGGMALARVGQQLALLYRPDETGRLRLSVGGYE